MELFIIIIQKSSIVYHLPRYKTGTEFLIAPSCHRLPNKK